VIWLGLLTPCTALAQSAVSAYVPRADAEIVETLRLKPLDHTDIEFRHSRALLRARPTDPEIAGIVAAQAIAIARRDGDPRYLGIAEAALAPWWAARDAPVPLRVAKATILQSVHRFDAALIELDQVIKRQPALAQAWLTRATILQVQGRYGEAAAACLTLRDLGAEPFASACLAELSSLSAQAISPERESGTRTRGDATTPDLKDPRTRAQSARARLERLRAHAGAAPRSGANAWLDLMLAELNERLGDTRQAEAAFRRALAAQPDAYTKGAFADFLLASGRATEVIPLLEAEQRTDALLLRLALAQAATGVAEAIASRALLESRFAAARLRGDTVHRREEARFELQLRRRPQAALALARANWDLQKEPADAWILLEAARAAAQRAAAAPVRRFLDEHGLYDVRLEDEHSTAGVR
jgi:tetratricopeptide (TPR) repeat protein